MQCRTSGDIYGVTMALTHCDMPALDQADEERAGAHLTQSLTLLLNDVVVNQVLVWRDDLAGAGGRANQCRHGRRATRISSVAWW